MIRSICVACVGAAAVVALARGLPADAFFSGDSGLKLIAATEALAHPRRPFEIDLPQVAGRPAPLVDSMVVVHGTHGHVLQSPIFPVVSAPLIAAFGLRGAYVLPALAFVLMLPLLDLVRRQALPETSFAALAWLTIVANPLLFYALEYWEHAPAAAVIAAATAMAMIDRGERVAARSLGCGILMAAAILLRPEAVWYAVALGVTMPPRRWVAYGAGLALTLVPFAAINFLHMGDPLGPHASAVLAPVVRDFVAGRWQRVHAWLWPASRLEAAALLLIAGAWLFRLASDERPRQLLALGGALVVAVLAARNAVGVDSLWRAFPVALLACVPAGPPSPTVRRLWVLALVSIGGTILTASHDGGAQWGARYLLVASPALLLLAARGATAASGPGRWRVARVAVVGAILLAGALSSRTAYVELRGAKRRNGTVVTATARFTPPDSTILTNVWWFDQLTAALHGRRRMLVAIEPQAASNTLATLARERTPVTLVWSIDEGASLEPALDGTCYRITSVEAIAERGLRFAAARCGGSP